MRKLLPKLMSILMALAICSASGAHWMLLQSVAWVGMVATYAQDRPLTEAMADTFDGQHPCELCKVVSSGSQQERKSQSGTTPGALGKILLYFIAQDSDPSPAFQRAAHLEIALCGEARRDAPLLPPPRVS